MWPGAKVTTADSGSAQLKLRKNNGRLKKTSAGSKDTDGPAAVYRMQKISVVGRRQNFSDVIVVVFRRLGLGNMSFYGSSHGR